jgi:DNA-binding GntR family transcriptional regulator
VVAAIRDAIVQGRLRPGEKVPEDELAQQLGVSRTPIREAIRILEQQGLVRVRPKNGTYIAKVDRRDVADGLAVRIALEELAAREAIERSSDERWADVCERLDGLLAQMEHAVASNDAVTATELDVEFHTTLVRASDNRFLAQTWRLVGVPLLVWSPERELYPQTQAELIVGLSERHRELLDALRTRDTTAAAAAIRAHIQRKLADITARPSDDAPEDPRPKPVTRS